jgi:hypothetical protein
VRDDRRLTSAMHEIGHGLGLVHADTGSFVPGSGFTGPHPDGTPDCGGNSNKQIGEAWPPDNKGYLRSVGLDRRDWNILSAGSLPRTLADGYDSAGNPVAGKHWYDFMSYCDGAANPSAADLEADHWISARNWERLIAFHPPLQTLPAATDRAPYAAGPLLRVIATVDSAGAVSIFNVATGTTTVVGPKPDSGYTIEARDARGAVLSSSAPLLSSVHIDGTSGQRPPLLIEATLPMPAGTAAVVVTGAGRDLAELTRSRRAPTVRVLAPRSGASIGHGATTIVRWAADDADGDRLTAAIDYSADGGSHWQVVADRMTGESAHVPTRLLAAARNAQLRVRISDGFDVTKATVSHLRAPGAPPVVQILDVAGTRTLPAGGTLPLPGAALDDAGIPLTGRHLRWYAGHRLIGTGERVTLTDLPAGATTIRLVATDSHGRTATAPLRVEVRAPAPHTS